MVVFEPVEEATADKTARRPSANGEIQADGRFRLGTFKPGDGAVPGRHRALVQPPPAPEVERQPRKLLLDPRFQSFQTSGLEFTVKESANDITVTVKPPVGRPKR